MAHATKKTNRKTSRRKTDAFSQDEIEGEYENPGPRIDSDAAKIRAMISDIKKRDPVGFVVNWRPKWLKRANAVAHDAAVLVLHEAKKELGSARTDEERAQGNMRVQMATDTVNMTYRALEVSSDADAISIYFFEDKLAVDLFDRGNEEEAEMDALSIGMKPLHQNAAGLKSALCAKHGILYLALGPDDELDPVQLAAKLGKTTAKRMQHPTRTSANSGDGITEEEI